jgi:hypothetical protein
MCSTDRCSSVSNGGRCLIHLSNSFAWGDSRELDYIDVDCASVMVAVGAADIARERATD